MRRQLLGLVAATFATPYLFDLLQLFARFFRNGTVWFPGFIDVLTFGFLESSGLIHLFGGAFLLSGTVALVLYASQGRKSWQALGCGILIGIVTSTRVLFEPMLEMEQIFDVLVHRAVEGGIAGLIYWRVAIRPRTDNAGPAPSRNGTAADGSDSTAAPASRRRLSGLIAATILAPYVIVACALLSDGDLLPYASGGDLSIEDLVFYGTVGLVFYGLPLLAVAGIAVAVLTRLGWASSWIVLAVGAVTGSGIMAVTFGGWSNSLIGAASGTFCGWIYWRIALRSENAPGSS